MREFDADDVKFFQDNLIFWAPYPGYINFYFKAKEYKLGDDESLDNLYEWVKQNQ